MTGPTSRPALRRLPSPACEPPFDDEVGGGSDGRGVWARAAAEADAAQQGTLALAFVLPNGLPAVPAAPVGLRLVTQPARSDLTTGQAHAGPRPHVDPHADPHVDLDDDEVGFGPQPTARAELPEPRSWATRLTQGLVEVLAGDRPPGQLVRWTSAEVFDDVAALAVPRGPGRASTPRGVVRSLHVSEPADGVAEVAALVRRGRRTTAMALRLEGLDGRWQCTALELG